MDLRVFNALHVAGVAAIVALTAQNSRGVRAVAAMSARFVRRQLEAIWEEAAPAAVCIGLLADARATREVRVFLNRLTRLPAIVIDPVITSSSGYTFVGDRELRELRKLLPLATVVTPNVSEAEVLANRRIRNMAQVLEAALNISKYGCAVLVTGGHLRDDRCVDVLASNNQLRHWGATRIAKQMRGAGGILAAAITASLASGLPLERSILRARAFVRRAWRRALPLRSGKPVAGF
jgi:hydroxymethylpyrimidine kinase/phosphomethylpyrimidine kinase